MNREEVPAGHQVETAVALDRHQHITVDLKFKSTLSTSSDVELQ
jgi:hypothetical protein